MKRAIYWFRNNLRLKDNPSLVKACQECDEILLVFVWPDWWEAEHEAGFHMMGELRRSFLEDSLKALRYDLDKRGLDLYVVKGDPVQVISDLAERTDVTTIYTSREVGDYELREIETLSRKYEVIALEDGALLKLEDLPFSIDKTPHVFTRFRKTVEKQVQVRDALPAPDFPAPIELPKGIVEYHLDAPTFSPDSRSAFPFAAGENAAWSRIDEYFWESENLSRYKYTRNGLIGPDYSSKLSPYLATGAISPVSIYWEVKRYEQDIKKNVSTYWLIFEILWREFFRAVTLKHGRKIFFEPGINDVEWNSNRDPVLFERWATGNTGQDFVDANMRELNATGFMSNRGRQNVASYLTHDMKLPWTWGAAYFESQLIDYDVSSNWGNWMYVAGVGNDPRNRVFNVEWQAKKYDPRGAYRELWNAMRN